MPFLIGSRVAAAKGAAAAKAEAVTVIADLRVMGFKHLGSILAQRLVSTPLNYPDPKKAAGPQAVFTCWNPARSAHLGVRNLGRLRGETRRTDGPRPPGTSCRCALSQVGDLDNFLLDCVLHKLRLVVDVQLAHEIEFVCFDRLDAQVEVAGDLFYRLPLR